MNQLPYWYKVYQGILRRIVFSTGILPAATAHLRCVSEDMMVEAHHESDRNMGSGKEISSVRTMTILMSEEV